MCDMATALLIAEVNVLARIVINVAVSVNR